MTFLVFFFLHLRRSSCVKSFLYLLIYLGRSNQLRQPKYNFNKAYFHIIIYTTKIDTFVCPPHISETVAVRIMKLAHRSRIASTTKKIISKQILLSILSILF